MKTKGRQRQSGQWMVSGAAVGVGGGMGGHVDREGALRFGAGRGRPWGRVARGFLRSKVKVSEWSNFGSERLLGAANGDEPKRRIRESKSSPIGRSACSLPYVTCAVRF
jgi:hypothetical protein